MSFHFFNGTTSGAYADTGPGTIIVDPLAEVHGTTNAALTLASGPWTVTVKGNVHSDSDEAIVLSDGGAFVSTIAIGTGATVATPANNRAAIATLHATNIKNAGHITSQFFAGIDEIGDGDFRIENVKGGSIQGAVGIFVESLGTHTIINAGKIDAAHAISSLAGVEKVTNYGLLLGDVHLGAGNDVLTDFKKIKLVVKQGTVTGSIFGEAGNDTLKGGSHKEVLVGGLDKDTLIGGGGGDKFVFNDAVESAVGANRDTITDFDHFQHDKIDLQVIDADTITGSNQAFHFIGAKGFHHRAGELQVKYNAARDVGIVSGDLNGDAKADFQIEVHSESALLKTDFVL